MKKLTAKSLLEEVREIQKQSSSGFFKPYPIEYTTQKELESGIDSTLQDILDGYGYMGATNVTVKGNTAIVKGNFELELDIKEIKPWWGGEDFGKDMKFVQQVGKDIVSKLPKGYALQKNSEYGTWMIVAPGYGDETTDFDWWDQQLWEYSLPSPTWPGAYIDHGGGNYDVFDFKVLSNNYKKDIATIAKFIDKEFKSGLAWTLKQRKKKRAGVTKKQADKFEGLPSRDIMESLNNWLRIAKRKYGDSYAKINEAYMDKYRKAATYSGGVQNIGDWVRDPYAWEYDPDGDFLIMSESSAKKIDKDFQSYMEKQHWWDPEQYYLSFSYSEKYWSDFEVRVFRK